MWCSSPAASRTGWRRARASPKRAGADIIDINMGCPAKHVANRQSGSALMRDLDHALTLIEATVGAVAVPVTLKMRLGWDDRSINAPELARRAEAAGVRMITRAWPHALPVLQGHGRLGRGARGQGRDLDSARRQRRHPELRRRRRGARAPPAPTPSWSAARRRAGRGCPGQIARYLETGRREQAPPLATQFALIAALYEEMLAHHGLRIGLRHARKHLGWALDAAAASAGVALDTLKRWRGTVLTSETPADARARLAEAYDAFACGAAA